MQVWLKFWQSMNKKVLLTFDYELFLGADSGTALQCLIKPVDTLLEILEKNNAKAVFFVDATYLLTLHINGHKDFEIISNQLRSIVEQGSRIELHLHPQWLDAVPIGENRWKFNSYSHYRLHSLADEQISKLFKDGKALLQSVVESVDPSYRVSAFRAGGWSVEPFSRLKESFINESLLYDLSVLPGKVERKLPLHYYDYSEASLSRECWQFENGVCDADVDEGQFLEIPVTMVSVGRRFILANQLKIKGNKILGDGKGVRQKSSFYKKLIKLLFPGYQSLSIDYCSLEYFDELVRSSKKQVDVAIGHPKVFTNKTFQLLDNICSKYETILIEDMKRFV